MRVLMIGDLSYVHVQRWARGIAGRGVELYLLTSTLRDMPGVRLIPGRVPRSRLWGDRRWLARWRGVFRRALIEAKPDLVHLHFPHTHSVLLDELRGIPLLVSTWGVEILPMVTEPARDRESIAAILRAANGVFGSSQFLARATADYAGLPPERVRTIYWGVDLEQFAPSTRPVSEPVIGFTRTLHPKYGVEYLVKAIPLVLKAVPAARVLMVRPTSSEDEFRKFREQLARLGIDDRFTILEYLDHKSMPGLYARMALSVVPSVHESDTLAVSALESQAMRVPVVASRIGGLTESVLDGQTGLIVPPRDPEALAQAIVRLLMDHDLRDTLGAQGRQHVERRFDWRRTLDQTIDYYHEILSVF